MPVDFLNLVSAQTAAERLGIGRTQFIQLAAQLNFTRIEGTRIEGDVSITSFVFDWTEIERKTAKGMVKAMLAAMRTNPR